MYEHQEVKLKMQLDVLYVIDCSFYNNWLEKCQKGPV